LESAAQRKLDNYTDHDLLVRTVTLLDVLTIDLRSLRSDHEQRLRKLERLVYMGLGGLAVIDVIAHTFLKLH
jgi:hypothetical protein